MARGRWLGGLSRLEAGDWRQVLEAGGWWQRRGWRQWLEVGQVGGWRQVEVGGWGTARRSSSDS